MTIVKCRFSCPVLVDPGLAVMVDSLCAWPHELRKKPGSLFDSNIVWSLSEWNTLNAHDWSLARVFSCVQDVSPRMQTSNAAAQVCYVVGFPSGPKKSVSVFITGMLVSF